MPSKKCNYVLAQYIKQTFVSDGGGDRVSWEKQWFASPDIWTLRAKFDVRVRNSQIFN